MSVKVQYVLLSAIIACWVSAKNVLYLHSYINRVGVSTEQHSDLCPGWYIYIYLQYKQFCSLSLSRRAQRNSVPWHSRRIQRIDSLKFINRAATFAINSNSITYEAFWRRPISEKKLSWKQDKVWNVPKKQPVNTAAHQNNLLLM